MSPSLLRVIAALTGLSGAACSLPGLLQKNLKAIEASTVAITENKDTVERSTKVSEEGIKSFEGLRGPMESMAKLDPTLKAVAALDDPMKGAPPGRPGSEHAAARRAGAADDAPWGHRASLDATAALGPSMDRLAAMRPSLDAVAALGDPMKSVAALQPPLAAVADLRAPMEELSALRQPLERVADLREPMTRLSRLGALLDHPILLIALALVGLGLWAAVTFLAVRLAILSASRAALARGGA